MGSKQLEQAVEALQEASRLAPNDLDVRGVFLFDCMPYK